MTGTAIPMGTAIETGAIHEVNATIAATNFRHL